MLQVAVETHQHRCQPHEAVQDSHQLRHFGHLDLLRQTNTDRPADHHRKNNPADAVWLSGPRMVAIRAMAIPAMPK